MNKTFVTLLLFSLSVSGSIKSARRTEDKKEESAHARKNSTKFKKLGRSYIILYFQQMDELLNFYDQERANIELKDNVRKCRN